MIHLEPFTTADFDRLIAWVNSLKDLVQFAGPSFTYPLTHAQLNAYLSRDGIIPFRVVLDENNHSKVIGHCEINLTTDFPRLSRILIGDPELRGKGYGTQIVKLLIEKIKAMENPEIIDLNVFSWNKTGIRCYEKIGFRIIEENTDVLNYLGLSWKRLNMQYRTAGSVSY